MIVCDYISHTVAVVYKSVFDVIVFYRDLTPLMRAERRAPLNRSTSLLDLSTSHKTDNDLRCAAGSRLSSTSARPVPDSQPELKAVVESGVVQRNVDARRRRVTMDVTTSRQLPRMISSLIVVAVVVAVVVVVVVWQWCGSGLVRGNSSSNSMHISGQEIT